MTKLNTQTRKRPIDLARWPNRLNFRESQRLASALVAQQGSREAAAARAEVSVVTLGRWVNGIDRAPASLKKLVKKRRRGLSKNGAD